MYKAIVFDMDDTLIRTREAKYQAHKYVAKYCYNMEITDDDLNRVWGQPFEKMMKGLYRDIEKVEKIIEKYVSHSGKFPISSYGGASEIVVRLAKRVPVGLVTAASMILTKVALEEAKIEIANFGYVQTSEDTKFHKPDPRVFNPTWRHFQKKGINKDEILYVGDALRDYQAANGVGFGFVGIAGHTHAKSEFEQVGARVVESFEELFNLI